MKVFITGGAGFIGINTAAYYLKKKAHVTIFDNMSRPGVEHNLAWLKNTFKNHDFSIILADVRDYRALAKAAKHTDLIFHLAGQTAVTTSIKNPRIDFEANALGTFNVCEALRLVTPAAVLLYASTNKVYGSLSGSQKKSMDEQEPLNFHSPYGCSKGVGDQYVRDYSRIYNLKTIVFRQSCIYGEHQFGVEDQGWVAHFIKQAVNKKPITIYGDGTQVRDILHVDDLILAYDQATKKIIKTKGQVYNIGGGVKNKVSLLEIVNYIKKSNPKLTVNYGQARTGDQVYYVSNTNKASHDFGWHPRVSNVEGLKRLQDWLKREKPFSKSGKK